MAKKYHVNDRGNPGACRAKDGGCPFGGEDVHYGSKKEARAGYEAVQTAKIAEATAAKQAIADFRAGLGPHAAPALATIDKFIAKADAHAEAASGQWSLTAATDVDALMRNKLAAYTTMKEVHSTLSVTRAVLTPQEQHDIEEKYFQYRKSYHAAQYEVAKQVRQIEEAQRGFATARVVGLAAEAKANLRTAINEAPAWISTAQKTAMLAALDRM